MYGENKTLKYISCVMEKVIYRFIIFAGHFIPLGGSNLVRGLPFE